MKRTIIRTLLFRKLHSDIWKIIIQTIKEYSWEDTFGQYIRKLSRRNYSFRKKVNSFLTIIINFLFLFLFPIVPFIFSFTMAFIFSKERIIKIVDLDDIGYPSEKELRLREIEKL